MLPSIDIHLLSNDKVGGGMSCATPRNQYKETNSQKDYCEKKDSDRSTVV